MTYSQTLARPGGGEWQWSDFANLQVIIVLRGSYGIKCTQVYVEITSGALTVQVPLTNSNAAVYVPNIHAGLRVLPDAIDASASVFVCEIHAGLRVSSPLVDASVAVFVPILRINSIMSCPLVDAAIDTPTPTIRIEIHVVVPLSNNQVAVFIPTLYTHNILSCPLCQVLTSACIPAVSPTWIGYCLLIAGKNFTHAVPRDSLRITSAIGERIDTCAFRMEDPPYDFQAWDTIIITDENDEKIFAGYIINYEADSDAIKRIYQVSCSDYTARLGKVRVKKEYKNQTSKAIIEDLFNTYLPSFETSTYVETGITVPWIYFNYCTLREAMAQLAAINSFETYIDYDMKVHFGLATPSAPFSISDTPNYNDSFPCENLKHQNIGQGLENRIRVRGGVFLTGDVDIELAGNGQTTILSLPYKSHEPSGETGILVYRNDGSDESPNWVQLSVGVDFIDELPTKDVLHNFQEKLLKFYVAPPNLKRAVKITARQEKPLVCEVRSQASKDAFGDWFDGLIIDQNIRDLEVARRTGEARLAEYAFTQENKGQVAGSFRCRKSGLRAGQKLHVVNSLRQIDDYFLIQEVATAIVDSEPVFDVKYGAFIPSLVELLLRIKEESARYIEPRPEEAIIEVLQELITQTVSPKMSVSVELITKSGAYNFDDAAYFDKAVFDGGS
jgi:hypothetical protein